jgi:hypothetical protein
MKKVSYNFGLFEIVIGVYNPVMFRVLNCSHFKFPLPPAYLSESRF